MSSRAETTFDLSSTAVSAAAHACRFGFIKQLWRKPKKGDSHLLAQFYREDSKLQQTVMRLLVIPADQQASDEAKQLSQRMRKQQGGVMNLVMQIVHEALPDDYDRREFRAKYTEDVVTDNINGALWHAVECLSYGVEIAYHPAESVELQPLAAQVSSLIDVVRNCLRLHCHVKDVAQLPQQVIDLLKTFDEAWAKFEWTYASLMCPVMTIQQYDHQQECIVLFCEAAQRALRKGWLSGELFEYIDPVLMFAIPRLAIVAGLTIFRAGPLNLERPAEDIPQCFRVFLKVLHKVKNLLDILTPEEQDRLESALCSSEGLCSSNRSTNGQLKAVTVVVKRRPRTQRLGAVSQPEDVDAEQDAKKEKSQTKSSSEKKSVPRWEEPSAQELRAAFPSSDDLLQRLFVAISGIADQMQTNFAGPLRSVLQAVFTVCTPSDEEDTTISTTEANSSETSTEGCDDDCLSPHHSGAPARLPLSPRHAPSMESPQSSVSSFESPLHAASTGRPVWVPDHQCSTCLACEQPFTMIRRKHHCRSCGQVFCSRCSGQFIPLPHLQYSRPVRVCDTCFTGSANIA